MSDDAPQRRLGGLEAVFRRIATTRMRGVPVLNPALSVQAVGFGPDPLRTAPGAWWRLNGERIGNGGSSSSASRTAWRPVAGRHVLELMSAEGQVLDSVTFAVRAPVDDSQPADH